MKELDKCIHYTPA